MGYQLISAIIGARASLNWAFLGSVPCMTSHMIVSIANRCKSPNAFRVFIGLLAGMSPMVHHEIRPFVKSLLAFSMGFQINVGTNELLAHWAIVKGNAGFKL